MSLMQGVILALKISAQGHKNALIWAGQAVQNLSSQWALKGLCLWFL